METTISRVAKRLAHMADANSVSQVFAQVLDVKSLSRTLEEVITKQKDDIVNVFAKEFSRFLARIDLSRELKKVFKDLRARVTFDIGFFDGEKPVKHKRQKRKGKK